MLPTMRNRGRVWNDPFDAMHRDLDNLLTTRWYGDGGATASDLVGHYPVDISEDEDHLYIEAEMPGFRKGEVDVTLENGMLTISGERKMEKKEKGTSHLMERRYTRVHRSFSLPTTVDESKVDAKLSEGVLAITLNKREEVKPRRIEVK